VQCRVELTVTKSEEDENCTNHSIAVRFQPSAAKKLRSALFWVITRAVKNYHYSLPNNSEERSSHTAHTILLAINLPVLALEKQRVVGFEIYPCQSFIEGMKEKPT
jgi:hypothetical protein